MIYSFTEVSVHLYNYIKYIRAMEGYLLLLDELFFFKTITTVAMIATAINMMVNGTIASEVMRDVLPSLSSSSSSSVYSNVK